MVRAIHRVSTPQKMALGWRWNWKCLKECGECAGFGTALELKVFERVHSWNVPRMELFEYSPFIYITLLLHTKSRFSKCVCRFENFLMISFLLPYFSGILALKAYITEHVLGYLLGFPYLVSDEEIQRYYSFCADSIIPQVQSQSNARFESPGYN
jgi:hypothetical protein